MSQIIRRGQFGPIALPVTRKFSRRGNFLFLHRGVRFIFLVKKIFFLRLKIKFIFFLSISPPISSLKPAGEGSQNAHVNKL